MRVSYSVVLMFVVVAILTVDIAAAQDIDECSTQKLPANIDMPADLRDTLGNVYDRSPRFRAQCDRIAAATNLRVSVRVETIMHLSCRAFTVFRRRRTHVEPGFSPAGTSTLLAVVHLPTSGSLLAELIGHEFEHILEQIEGLDLRALAQVRDSGVVRLDENLYETDRAARAGRAIDKEAHGRSRARQSW